MPTFVCAVQVTLHQRDQLLVLPEAGVVVAVVAEAVHGGDICAAPQQHLDGVPTGVLTSQDKSSPETKTRHQNKPGLKKILQLR